ncbi:MAG: DUF3100 domain-containing protein [Hungatella sp.]
MWKDKIWSDYKFHLAILACCIAAERIGVIRIPLGGITITFLPLLYAMILVLGVYLIKPIRFVDKKQADIGAAMLSLSVAFLMAKLGITSGSSIKQVISAGPVLILQNLGNVGTLVIALPIAILMGMKREAIGMTHAMSREPNVALISDVFGPNSAEFKGVMTCYIVGTIFGTIFMSIIPPLFVSLGIFSPESAAMAVGAGSASMMTAGLAGIIDAAPTVEPDTLTAFASISNVISSSISVYLGLFVTIPLGNAIYKAMNRKKMEVV